MAYQEPVDKQVGDAITKEFFDNARSNAIDLNSRMNSVEASSPKIPVIKFDVRNASQFATLTGIYYHEADDNFTITNAFLRIFETGALAGSVEIDIKKSVTDLNGTSFVSIFTTRPSVNYSTASNYDSSTNQVFDVGQINVSVGDFIRLDITQAPTNGVVSKILITVYGE